ncbi:hypothetical protein [Acidithiobacillus thiooxidans]|uniref:hypothetical protein n=1 Tax=Acidithiobacillus thiooxidans TaxID=930 RepID=UPI0004E0E10D|nr:hypothetical protein [Acidithiobacillus thiooxidans]
MEAPADSAYCLRFLPEKPKPADGRLLILTSGRSLVLSAGWIPGSLAWCPLRLAPVHPAPAPKGSKVLLYTPQRRWVLGISQFAEDHRSWAPLPELPVQTP